MGPNWYFRLFKLEKCAERMLVINPSMHSEVISSVLPSPVLVVAFE
jgi:hypothetical protein